MLGKMVQLLNEKRYHQHYDGYNQEGIMYKELLEAIIKLTAIAENTKDRKTFISLQKVIKQLWYIYHNFKG